MNIIQTVLLVAFVIVCILIICLVLVQDDGQSGMGGLLGGRGTAAFGSHSASVLTKATGVFVALFFIIALALAVLNKKPKLSNDISDTSSRIENTADSAVVTDGVEGSAEEAATAADDKWYQNN